MIVYAMIACVLLLVALNTSTWSRSKIGSAVFSDVEDGDGLAQIQKQAHVSPSPPELTPALIPASSPYAYTWIIGSVHEERLGYKGFFWSILVSANILREAGSTADFWLYVRMAPDANIDTIPDEGTRILNALGFHVKYLNKLQNDTLTFSKLMYDKFEILNMTDYKRVMYLDADTMPLTNMDYLFHLSDPEHTALPTLLKPNFLMATLGEPSHGGMFIIEPSEHMANECYKTIEERFEKFKTLPYPHFDRGEGWGYHFGKHKDKWEAMHKSGIRWNWYGVHADQGLMYYLAKFMYKDVSIAIERRLQHWKAVEGEQFPVKEAETMDELERYQPPILTKQDGCFKPDARENPPRTWACNPPYSSFAHFWGSHKPWQEPFEMKYLSGGSSQAHRVRDIWFHNLKTLNDRHSMNLDFENWNDKYHANMKESPLGYMPMWRDQARVFSSVGK